MQALRERLEAAGRAVPPSISATVAAPPTRDDVREASALFDAHFRAATAPPLSFLDYLATENLRCEELADR